MSSSCFVLNWGWVKPAARKRGRSSRRKGSGGPRLAGSCGRNSPRVPPAPTSLCVDHITPLPGWRQGQDWETPPRLPAMAWWLCHPGASAPAAVAISHLHLSCVRTSSVSAGPQLLPVHLRNPNFQMSLQEAARTARGQGAQSQSFFGGLVVGSRSNHKSRSPGRGFAPHFTAVLT